MRKLVYIGALLTMIAGFAQVGEVSSEEIVIEKNKEITLPRADKLYLPVTPPDPVRDSIRLSFNVSSPRFNIPAYAPNVVPYAYIARRQQLTYQNFFKLGYGSFGSPLVSAYAGKETKKLTWGAWLHHESFAKGPVRNTQSGSSTSYADVFATLQNRRWSFTPTVGWQSNAYRFYGYDDSDTRATDDKSSVSNVRFSASLEEIYDNKFSIEFKPTFISTNQSTPSGAPSSSENYFDLSTKGSYKFDSTLSAGVELQLGAISFTSESKINRNYTIVNPWVGVQRPNLFIKAGVQIAATNDTIISGTKSFFYPDISAEWTGVPGWTVYGSLSGQLRPVTFNGLTQENVFLDDSLTMAHENVQTSIGGGIRGAITSKIHLNTGVNLSSVKNMSFFAPSLSDSARFIILVDPEAVTVFNLYGQLNWQPRFGTHIGMRADIYGYGIDTYDEAWNRPGFKLSMDWIQRYSDKISSRMILTSLAGIKAPAPVTYESQTLDAIVDLSIEGSYRINDRAEAFVLFQNVLGGEYQRFLNYPARGLAFKLGGTYRF